MRTYELTPCDNHKSFYGKAIVVINDDNTSTLISYNTPVIRQNADGTYTRLWWGWSATTGRHIRSFCGMDKAEYTALPYEG